MNVLRTALVAFLFFLFLGCGSLESSAPGTLLKSEKQRITAPDVSQAEVDELVLGNTAFAIDMYQALSAEADGGNLFFSPHSISIALGMTWAGARVETESQMASTLHFTLGQESQHPAFNHLDLALSSRGEGAEGQDGEGFRLHVINALFGQEGYHFEADFLDTLAENYGAGLQLLDFVNAHEAAREAINLWVEDETEGRIDELLPENSIKPITRLVLTNAIYFNAAWAEPFNEEQTFDRPFERLGTGPVDVPMMHLTHSFPYSVGAGYKALELPYDGDELSMLILLPDPGEFDAFQASLGAENLGEIVDSLAVGEVELSMPRWTFKTPSISLKDLLIEMGMPIAFDGNLADFSGMTGARDLYIGNVFHKAFVSVNEAGTEAAAATAVIMDLRGEPEGEVISLNRPFIYLIRDREIGALLFVGRVTDPS